MLNNWQSHREYLAFLHEAKIHFDSSQRTRLNTELTPIREKLRLLNLDPVMEYLQQFYSNTGRPAKNQPQIIRSLVLFFLFSGQASVKGLTKWCKTLKHDPVLAALAGCTTGSLPPLGSYFDMMDRLWLYKDRERYSRNKLFPPLKNSSKPERPAKKGQKAKERHSGIVKKICNRLLNGKQVPFHFESILQNILLISAVKPSIKRGLIPDRDVILSGDGTCVHSHTNPFGKRFSKCPFNGSCTAHEKCYRHYSDPDAGYGWDSDLEDQYFGYTLYNLSVHNKDLAVDLPVMVRFTSARRHDSVNALVALSELRLLAPEFPIQSLCLDAAHDNYATYELLHVWGIQPFIDLNSACGRQKSIPDRITTDPDGTPVCQAGHRMVSCGYDRSKHGIKYRCPYVMGKVDSCDCVCSKSAYGRTIHMKTDWDLRLYTPVPRGTEKWKDTYKNRSCTERINNRILNNYGLHAMRIHTKKHYSFMTMIICICIHLDAWYKQITALGM